MRTRAVIRTTLSVLSAAIFMVACTRAATGTPRIVSNDSTGAMVTAESPTATSPTPRSVPQSATTLSRSTTPSRPGDAIAAAVPHIDAALKARLREIYRFGAAHGLRPDVFAKVGDSITESASFLQDIGHGWFDLAGQSDLQPIVDYFHHRTIDSESNDSFAHGSAVAVAGWTSGDALEHDGATPLVMELEALHPAFAIVMYGSNDIDRASPESLGTNLTRIVDECLRRGVIPILSTIPDRRDTAVAAARVPAFNRAIVAVARARSIPLMDLHAALAPLPTQGISEDGVHPNVWVHDNSPQAAHFNPEALRFGYNVRNLLALRTLAKVRAIVAMDGTPDQ